jgi:two-component system chemotaxis sensor kinase CheA
MDLIRSFLAEADELLSAINEQILELESDPSRVERVNEIYRAAHTLKGSANLYGFSGIAVVTHLLESLLGEIREGLLTPGASLTDLLLEGFDQVRTQVKRIASGAEDPQADPDLLYRLNQHVHMESGLPPVMDAAAGEPPRFNGTPEEWLDEVRSCIQQYVRGEGRTVPPIELLGSFPSAGGKQAYGGAGLSAEERISLVGEIKKSAANLQRRRRSTVQLQDKLAELRESLLQICKQLSAWQGEHDGLPQLLSVVALLEAYAADPSAGAGALPGWWHDLWNRWSEGLECWLLDKPDDTSGDLMLDLWELCSPGYDTGPVAPGKLLMPEVEESDWLGEELSLAGEEVAAATIPSVYEKLWEPPANTIDTAMTRRLIVEQLHFYAPKGRPLAERWELARRILKKCAALICDERLEALADQPYVDIFELKSKIGEYADPNTVLPLDTDYVSGDHELLFEAGSIAAAPSAKLKESKGQEPPNDLADHDKIVRIGQGKIDRLMELIGELVIAKNAFPYLLSQLPDRQLARAFNEKYSALDRIAKELQDAIIEVRMLPLSTVFAKFNRFVRDLAKQSGRKVRLSIIGEDTTLDKNLVDALSEPLIHLVRNAIDHGIEPEEERLREGKPPEGQLCLQAWREGNKVIVEVSDDGRGIDTDKIRSKISQLRLISEEEAVRLSSEEVLSYIFRAGFTTADGVTPLSGRGVGMDAVQMNVQAMQGNMTIHSEPGEGTTVRIELPLTLTMTQVLQVVVRDRLYGIPLDQIRQTMRTGSEEIRNLQGKPVMMLAGEVIPIMPLRSFLGLADNGHKEVHGYMVVLNNGVSLQVDAFRGQQEVVIKPLDPALRHLTYLTGASILGDGTVLLILNGEGISVG